MNYNIKILDEENNIINEKKKFKSMGVLFEKVNSNIFCLFVCVVAIVISEFFINVVGLSLFSFISQIILFILLAVSIHEFGHYITGRLIGFKLIFLTSILGIQTQKILCTGTYEFSNRIYCHV